MKKSRRGSGRDWAICRLIITPTKIAWETAIQSRRLASRIRSVSASSVRTGGCVLLDPGVPLTRHATKDGSSSQRLTVFLRMPRASGLGVPSSSISQAQSCRFAMASSTPHAKPPEPPRFSPVSKIVHCGNSERTMSGAPSVEPLSTTITSSAASTWRQTELRQERRSSLRLYDTTTTATLTKGSPPLGRRVAAGSSLPVAP